VWRFPPTRSTAEVKERVELYLISLSGAIVACARANFTLSLPLPSHFIDSTLLAALSNPLQIKRIYSFRAFTLCPPLLCFTSELSGTFILQMAQPQTCSCHGCQVRQSFTYAWRLRNSDTRHNTVRTHYRLKVLEVSAKTILCLIRHRAREIRYNSTYPDTGCPDRQLSGMAWPFLQTFPTVMLLHLAKPEGT
jgi:hypothetical protein